MMSRNKEKNDAVCAELSKFIPVNSNGVCIGDSGDVRKPEDCKRVVGKAVELFGKVDVLVNGAAGNFLA